MGELHKFLFEGLPVRGMLVRLTGSWRELLARRDASQGGPGAYPAPVRSLLGEMAAASVLMQANIKFNGALILQMQGDGPVKLAVAEARPDLGFRVTASVKGAVPSPWTHRTACPASNPTRAWCRCTATSVSPCRRSARCWSTTCCRASNSTRAWCWQPTTRWPQAC